MDRIADTELEICSAATMAGHPELFHYTKRPAFEGIVTSNSFWASHYADMADKTEVLLLKDQLPEAIAPEYEAIVAPLPRHKRRLFKASGGGIGVARDFVNSLYGATFHNKSGFTALDAFMVSFSTHAGDGDAEREHGLQSQWKEYAGPDGFCLVFDTKQMAEHLGSEMDRAIGFASRSTQCATPAPGRADLPRTRGQIGRHASPISRWHPVS